MDSLRRPLSSTLALSRADLAVGLREFDNAMRPFDDWLDGSIRLFRASAVGFVYLSMIVVAAAMYSLFLNGTAFFAPPIVLDYICAVALLGAAGAVAWHYPIIRQRNAASGRLPPALMSEKLKFVHEYRLACYAGLVDVFDAAGSKLERAIFSSEWAVVLFSENPRVRGMFLLSAQRSFKAALTAENALHSASGAIDGPLTSSDQITPHVIFDSRCPGPPATQSGALKGLPDSSQQWPDLAREFTRPTLASGKRRTSSVEKREWLATLNESQLVEAVDMFLDPAVIAPSSHAKYRLAITIIHQRFRNGRTENYNVTEAIQAAVKAVTERFEKVSLRASVDGNLGMANDAKRAPADANSTVWINKIAYGTNRRLRDKCDLANGQMKLKL